MKIRQIKTKSDAVRTAVDEALQFAQKAPTVNLRDLFGERKLPPRPRKYWLKEGDLWRKRPLLTSARKKCYR